MQKETLDKKVQKFVEEWFATTPDNQTKDTLAMGVRKVVEESLIDCLPAFPPRHLLKDKKRLRELALRVWKEKQKAKHEEYLVSTNWIRNQNKKKRTKMV